MNMVDILKGKNLILNERDLIRKSKIFHVVFDSRICRPSIISDTKRRGEQKWYKLYRKCDDFRCFKKIVQEFDCIPCKFCVRRLEKVGYEQK